jgi:hypothetical protein
MKAPNPRLGTNDTQAPWLQSHFICIGVGYYANAFFIELGNNLPGSTRCLGNVESK